MGCDYKREGTGNERINASTESLGKESRNPVNR